MCIPNKLLILQLKLDFYRKKIRNSDNYIYDYDHSLFGKEILIQAAILVFMIMLTRSSERIFNPMRYTG